MRLCRASAGGTAGQPNSRTTYGTIPSGVSLTEELTGRATRPAGGSACVPRSRPGAGERGGHGVARPVARSGTVRR